MNKNLITRLLIASPFLIIAFAMIKNTGPIEVGMQRYRLMEMIIGGFCWPPIIYFLYHFSSNSLEKTGRSFKSKSGVDIEEYKTVNTPAKPMIPNQEKIMKLYFIIGIIFFFFYYIFK